MSNEMSWPARLVCLAGSLVLLWFGIWVGNMTDAYKCRRAWEGASVPYRYKVVAGCQVRDPKAGWIPADHFRAVN